MSNNIHKLKVIEKGKTRTLTEALQLCMERSQEDDLGSEPVSIGSIVVETSTGLKIISLIDDGRLYEHIGLLEAGKAILLETMFVEYED